MTAVPETIVVDEIPDAMKKLASFIARGFYSKEHGIIIDMLKRNVCMKEEQLREITKLDIRQLRTILIALKQDKLIKERQLVEERSEGSRPVKINYYFINYRALLNVTKYKLDHMRSLLAKFNEQMCPLFLLLQELDGVQLAPHLLEPTPATEKDDGLQEISESLAPEELSPRKEVGQNEIVETLLAHETREDKQEEKVKKEEVEKEEEKNRSSSDSEFEDVEGSEGESTVLVQGQKYELSEVSANPALVQQMTAEEKEEYIRISQQHVYD